MSKKFGDLNDLFAIFEDVISTADVISADCQAKISSAIVKKRIELNLSQKAFAEKLGVSQGMVSKWESDDYNFTIQSLADIAAKLNMHLHVELVDEVSDNPQYITPNNYNYYSYNNVKFTIPKVISISKYKSDKYNPKEDPKEM